MVPAIVTCVVVAVTWVKFEVVSLFAANYGAFAKVILKATTASCRASSRL